MLKMKVIIYNSSSIWEVQMILGDNIHLEKKVYIKMSWIYVINVYYFFHFDIFGTKIDIEMKVVLVNSIFNFYPKKEDYLSNIIGTIIKWMNEHK